MPHIIEINQLVKRYRNAHENAVDDVSFYVEEGSFFSLLGPNGAGKTTIISILTTILAKTGGSAMIDGFDTDSQSSAVRRAIGVIFQNPSLDLNLTAEENIRFHANLYNLYPYRPTFSLMDQSYRKRVFELAAVLGIEKDLHKPVKSLSGGMKRKLEIVRSLMHEPKVLFLDEPTTGLDPLSRRNLWEYLLSIRDRQKITIFLTTHYLEEAEGADYLCIINHGKLVARGTPLEIKAKLLDEYVEIDAADRIRLTAELRKKKLEYVQNGPFRLMPLKHMPVAQLVQKIETPLTSLRLHQPTLEDAYIKIINTPRT